MLFAIAFEMVLGVRMRRKGQAAEEAVEEHVRNIAAFPLAIPPMAGPVPSPRPCCCTVPRTISVQRALSSKRRRSQMARNREKSNDPWYAKVAFGLFLCVLVGSLVALYSGVPVVQFVTRGL